MAAQTNRERPIGTDGLTVRERDVLTRWDGGVSIERIAALTGISRTYVQTVVTQYAFADEERLQLAAVADANTRFLAAIAATGGRFA